MQRRRRRSFARAAWGAFALYRAKSWKFERAHLSESERSIHEKREKEGSRELEAEENSILSCSLSKQNRELGIHG
ncbi:hypothetical protein AAC387_Pa04g1917 [Persea americana]